MGMSSGPTPHYKRLMVFIDGSNLLIELGKEIAKKRGKKKLVLSTFATNKQGMNLYKKCGFRIAGTYEKQYLVKKNNYVDEILMENWMDKK